MEKIDTLVDVRVVHLWNQEFVCLVIEIWWKKKIPNLLKKPLLNQPDVREVRDVLVLSLIQGHVL
jgi:hypothetical protein